ncbi:MAG: hypothetical protein IJN50_02350 [Clostridia bacterium]|nr:hypothetical protein [Clostridia bacterium]
MKNEETEKSLREMLDETNQALANIQSRMKNLHDLGNRLRYNSEFRSEVIQKNSDILGKYSEKDVGFALNICGDIMLELSEILHEDTITIPLPIGDGIPCLIDSCFELDMTLKDIQCLLDRVSTEKIEFRLSNDGTLITYHFI